MNFCRSWGLYFWRSLRIAASRCSVCAIHTATRTKKLTSREPPRFEINVMHHAGVVHFSQAVALRNFFEQIRQPNIGTVAFNQALLSILACASAFGARQVKQRLQ